MLQFIREIELFRDLADDEYARLAQVVQVLNLNAGDYLFEQNRPRRALFIVREGEIELLRNDTFDGNRHIITFGKNDFLGEGAFLDDSPHSTSARALTDATVFSIARSTFLQLLEEDSAVVMKVLPRVAQAMARRMQEATTRVVSEAAQYVSGRTRDEHDLLGHRAVPQESYYGIQTLRGVENFSITGVPISHYPRLIEALAMVKMASAQANAALGLIPEEIASAIVRAGRDVLQGKLHNQFVLDMIQGGAGTSTNMNANEVLANRALEVLGRERGDYQYCHPNNHVNYSQSTNDAYPSALKIAMINSNKELVRELKELIDSLHAKGREFDHVLKMGRTQLQDAVPMTLGQEFEAYAVTLTDEIERLNYQASLLLQLNMGGTAIGTGLNTAAEFGERSIHFLREISGLKVTLGKNLIEETQDTGSFVMYSSTLKHLAIKLSKLCNDLRLLSSGPRAGLNEINLPKMQPGSSIMPGKVNPVIPETVNQIAFKVMGNNTTVSMAAEAGQLELNVMEPVIAACILESIQMLKNGIVTLKHRCIDGITANEDVCWRYVQNSIGIVTALSPLLGYEVCSKLAKEALESKRGIYDLVVEQKLLSKEELDTVLDPKNMLKPQVRPKS